MRTLVIDVGGTHVKFAVTGEAGSRQLPSGPCMSAMAMASQVLQATRDWQYEVISIGYPGPVRHGHPTREPWNLAGGWVGFDYERHFGRPVRMINDAAMQALGSYADGRMLFLGLGTGLGTTLIIDGTVVPLELGHLPYRGGRSYEGCLGARGLKRLGPKKWSRAVCDVVERFRAALQPDYIVIGGGNAARLKRIPEGARIGENNDAFRGGFRLWDAPQQPAGVLAPQRPGVRSHLLGRHGSGTTGRPAHKPA
jgi:polyphosphate glucokinase